MEGTQRLVPTGKVYRQIFDAEVQLVQALEDSGRGCGSPPQSGAGGRREPTEVIPVVRPAAGDHGVGMLSDRQLTWVDGFPNEGHVENPVLYKYYTEEQATQQREPESSHASREVRGLPDVLAPAKKGSDIIERIAESRRQRHETTLEDMHQALGLISAELEPKIEAAGEELMSRLRQNDVTLEELMSRLAEDEALVAFPIEGLRDLWGEVAAQTDLRRRWIRDLDATLTDIEASRMDKIREVFQEYTGALSKIAHLMAPDLQRLLDKESQGINQTVLSNRRAYTDLYARLSIADVERERRLHVEWTRRVADWKTLHTDASMQRFTAHMVSAAVQSPPSVQDVLDQMYREQETINARRLDLVNSLRDMKPPSSTKTSIYHWNEKLTNISVSIDELNQQYFNRVYAEYELVCQQCLEKVEELKADLVERGVCTEDQASQVVTDRCLPLVGNRQTEFEKDLEKMDKRLEQHNLWTLQRLKSLFKFCQGAAHVWDVHELGLARQERGLQEKLDQCRHLHDNHNQDREANLDILMDRMRQDASETALQTSLRKVLDMLDKIRNAYDKFHDDQRTIVEQYPDMVRGELSRLDSAVCTFFSVNRQHPEEVSRSASQAGSVVSTDSQRPKSAARNNNTRPKSRSASRGESPQQGAEAASPLPLVISEVLNTAKGTAFYVLTVAGEHGVPTEGPPSPGDPAFLTEVAPPGEELPDYLSAVDVSDDLLTDVRTMIRMNFLDFLEDWTEQSEDRAKSVVAAKVDELGSELDLRLHLHTPRARRAELDVHNVRAAELVMHSERVSRHCKGINQALSELKARFSALTAEHNALAGSYRGDVEGLEAVFINATKSAKLVALSSQLQSEQDKYMDQIRASLRAFRQHLDDTLQMLRESNARFIKSFRLFSDGGNFCPEEIDDFRKRLEKMSQKVDSSEGFIMADLEGMESKRLEQAAKVTREFEDRFKHHMVDLLFMEKIARWLTNTQVKVKAEVADSNSQAQRLAHNLADLQRKTDACERPNLDKESVSPAQLYDCLVSMLDAFHARSRYLDCVNAPEPRPASSQLAPGARVAFTADTIPPVSRAGKQAGEDPTVGVIKTILRTQKNRLEFGADAVLDGDLPSPQYTPHSHTTLLPPASREAPERTTKSRQSRHSDTDTRSKRSSKPGTASNSTATADRPQRAASGSAPGVDALMHSERSLSVASTTHTGAAIQAWHQRRKLPAAPAPAHTVVVSTRSKPGKIDKKLYVFGESHEAGEEGHLTGRTRRVLRDALDGLLTAAELYYRQKGNRAVTRPQALQDNFEDCANVIVQKLQSYYKQTDTYNNQCLQEFRGQLSLLEDLSAHIPPCVVKEALHQAITTANTELASADDALSAQLQAWDALKERHEQELRPALGHPQMSGALEALCGAEEARRAQYLEGVETHAQRQQELAVRQAQSFVEQLAAVTEQLLLQFDQLLTIDDVKKGRVAVTRLPTTDLLRRQAAGQPLEEGDPPSKVTRGRRTWTGLPKAELVVPGPPPALDRSPTTASVTSTQSSTSKKRGRGAAAARPPASTHTGAVTSTKTTLGQTATTTARDAAYQEYKAHFQRVLAAIKDQQVIHTEAADRWADRWTTSVHSVQGLY